MGRDRYNNTLYRGLPSTFSFSGSLSGPAPGSINTSSEAGPNGTYAGSYIATVAGNYTLNLYLNPGDQHISGSPFAVSILASTLGFISFSRTLK